MTTEPHPDEARTVRVEVYLREAAAASVFDRQRAVLERLYRCVNAGSVDEVTVDTWEQRVRAPEDTRGDDLLPSSLGRRKFAEFERWADERGYDLAPAFRRRQTASLVAYEPRDVVDLPVICLARYVDDDLREVVPRGTEEGVRTVPGELAALEDTSAPADQSLDALQ